MMVAGRQIGAARKLLKIKLNDLAKVAEVSLNTIAAWEREERVPRVESILKVRDALEKRGIVFSNGGSPGVKFDPSRVQVDDEITRNARR